MITSARERLKYWVERYFGDLQPAPAVARVQRWTPQLDSEVHLHLEDRVQLERVYFAWVGPPRFDPDEAALDVLVSILAEGRSSRLHRSLVYEKQIARDVNAYFAAMEIAGEIRIDATVVPGQKVEDAFMPVVVEVKSQEEFDSWLAEQQGGAAPAAAQAQTVENAAPATAAAAE